MNKTMRELCLTTKGFVVELSQPDVDNITNSIEIHADQIDTLIDWLEEAKREINK